MKIICGIYKITNLVNNKVYIGQSVNILKRFVAHRNRAFNPKSPQYGNYFYKSIRKYGLKNFKFEIIEKCNKEELNKKEQEYIALYKSNQSEFGYNLTEGGEASTYSKINKEEVEEIYKLLKETDLSQAEIGKKFNVNQRTISYINQGQIQRKENQNYPVRKESTYSKRAKDSQEEKFFCKKCGKEITVYSKTGYCYQCYIENLRENRPTKEELFKLLIENKGNFLLTSKILGVSDVAIHKWCKQYNIPFHSKDYK